MRKILIKRLEQSQGFIILLALFLLGGMFMVKAQKLKIDISPDRVSTGLDVLFERIGTIQPKSTYLTTSNYWTIGCETVDRNYTIYDEYKAYLAPLGMRRARFQCGWAKTERVKGQYDFKWLDDIVNDMASQNVEMWAELSYGNPIYEGGGNINLSGGLPTSEEALKAWDNWVEAMVFRYKGKIHEWEIWNEPDLNKGNTPDLLASFNLRTVKIIKHIDPAAKIAALTLASLNEAYIKGFLDYFKTNKALEMIDWISFHGYPRNPDMMYGSSIAKAKELIAQYSPNIKLRQGESGCPSEYQVKYHALNSYHWSELTQAKWLLRRMMGDRGHDVDDASIFCLMDMVYIRDLKSDKWDEKIETTDMEGKFKFFNRFGLIRCDSMKRAEKIKQSYYAVQNTVSVFDQPLVRIKNSQVSVLSANTITSFEYQNTSNNEKMLVMWDGTQIPADTYKTQKATVSIKESGFKNPVWVDLLSGRIYKISSEYWKRSGNIDVFEVPVYDSPVIITDMSSLPL